MKNKSNKIRKLEKNRFSLFSDDSECCYICGQTYNLSWHEIYAGRNRNNSMKYGECIRLCVPCHRKYQNNSEFNDYFHIEGQKKFIESYPDLDFLDIFKINYL